MRLVIVHYHLFKNAGSTVDHILQNNFGKDWRAMEGREAASKISPDKLAAFITENPDVRAISSHHAVFPPPESEYFEVFPIVFLRHPLDRIISVYEFERRQGMICGPITKGADHASRLSMRDYLRWRLDTSMNGVVHNTHTSWLLSSPRLNKFKIKADDYNCAVRTLSGLPFFGIVELFDQSIETLRSALASRGLMLDTNYKIMNRNEQRTNTLQDRLSSMRRVLGEEMWTEINERNHWDLQLYDMALEVLSSCVDTAVRGRKA